MRLQTKPYPLAGGEGVFGVVVVHLGSHSLAVAVEVVLQVMDDDGVLV